MSKQRERPRNETDAKLTTKAEQLVRAKRATAEYNAASKASLANMARLKALRMARDADHSATPGQSKTPRRPRATS